MKFFTAHPASVGETYFEHLRIALWFGARMVVGGLACMVHAFLPALFTTSGSEAIKSLHHRMVAARRAQSDAPAGLDFVI